MRSRAMVWLHMFQEVKEAAVASEDAVVIGDVVAHVGASEAKGEVVELHPVGLFSVGLGLLYLTYETGLHVLSSMIRSPADSQGVLCRAPGTYSILTPTLTSVNEFRSDGAVDI